jgi:hypothetical protein
MGHRVALTVAGSIVLLGVLGCGAARAHPPASLTTIQEASKPASRSQANQTCSEVAQPLKSVRPLRSGLAPTLSKVRAALVPLARLRPPASDAHAYHLLVAKLNAAIAWDSANSTKIFGWRRKFNAAPPLSKQWEPMMNGLNHFEYPVLLHDFDSEYLKPDLAPGLAACVKTLEAAQTDLVPFPPFSH